jgi:sulfite reductase (NADPH) flavoprotein alpha-component
VVKRIPCWSIESWHRACAQHRWGGGPFSSQRRVPATAAQEPLLVLYGSQSGNAESLAKKLAKQANAKGFKSRAASLDAVAANTLVAEKNVMLVTSTWGEGDMPDNAQSFWTAINQNGSSPPLKGLRYSVLALGDKNYGDTFCLAGRKMDERFQELGAQRLTDRVDCDVDFDEPASTWANAVFSALGTSATAVATETEVEAGYTKKNPFPSALLGNHRLNSTESAKDTRHIILSLAESGLEYEVGDALGVYVQNCPSVVDAVMARHGIDSSLRDKLISDYEVRSLLTAPVGSFDQENLRKLQPRLYSIASSLKAHPEEVHLTIGVVKYELDGVQHKGVASTFLSERLEMGSKTGVFVHKANHFRLPKDPNVPIIMVGPGTGIAPFRAFLEEREATNATGKNWLFFGDQKRANDFLYKDQVKEWIKSGLLTRFDAAFSRDQEAKIYVQDKMRESADELRRWIENGAHFYVCGDAKRMAKDVDAALREIAGDPAVDAMKKDGRYARDVY